MDIDDLPISIKQRVQIICCSTESDVENEERVGVSDVGGAGAAEVGHC